MTPARGFATLLLAAAAQPVAAERIAIPFAPPVGQQLAYDIDQHRPIAGKDSRFSAHRTVRFERVGDGYQLYAVLRSLDSDASDAAAASFRAASSASCPCSSASRPASFRASSKAAA